MSFHSIQFEVDELFDRTDHPNISHKEDTDYEPLMKIRKLPITPKESIAIIKDILEAIIYVSSHLIIYKPSQVFKEHIVYKHGRWGLNNLICYRDPNESQEFNPNRYYPMDYYEHEDDDSELVWSIGRMWFELLTDSRIPPIKALTDEYISNTILATSGIEDIRIVGLLKEILVVEKSKRIDLVTIIKHGLFEYEESSRLYLYEVIPNLSRVHNMSSLLSNKPQIESMIQKNASYNPYEEELFKRDFKEAIVIADLFDKVKKFINDTFEVHETNYEIAFSCYIIDLVSYSRLNSFKIKREENQYLIVLIYDKLDYTNYLQKLLELEDKIERKRKMKKFNEFRARLPKLLDSLQNFGKEETELAYFHFKNYLMSYAKHFRDQKTLKKTPMTAAEYISLIEIMLIRSSNYVFGYCRKYLFNEFADTKSPFNLRSVLHNIGTCTDIEKLKRLEKSILDLYFPSNKPNE